MVSLSVLVDTGVLYAHHDRDAERSDAATHAMDAVLEGALGQPVTSDYVYDEAVTLTLARTREHPAAAGLGRRIRGRGGFPDAFTLLHVDPQIFERSVEVFERYPDQGLSFTDATTVQLVEHHRIDHVLSFDDDFDGIVDRIDPRDLG